MAFSAKQKELMRQTQLNRCAHCGAVLGEDAEAHAIFRGEHDHDYWLQGELLHPECHRQTKTYGRKRPNPRDPIGY